ncbi:hypothetical protein [Nocardia caishijiensis]|uniref:CPBP family intramembrane metalloprotease n=1 Tax=Nocardia caishijiensis TaxID=184756 RepID=A0ABQ6YFY5_9NOCA|nr:hypothetical protein [Nocardia caishijiensis]KAF0836666.1 hypothetical protein FNL39_11374 [Nocardia caishijiensis]
MGIKTIQRITGAAACAGAGCTLIVLPLYFVHPGPPPDANVLTRCLLGLIGATLFVVFMSGFAHIVRQRDPERAWFGSLAATAGTAWLTVALVSTGLEVGAVIAAPEPIDPTITVSGTYVLYGTVSRLLEGLFLVAFAVAATRLFPRWCVAVSGIHAAVNFAFVPSLYFGNTPAEFYAANGWGTTATVGGLTTLWFFAIGIALIRSTDADREGSSVRVGGGGHPAGIDRGE